VAANEGHGRRARSDDPADAANHLARLTDALPYYKEGLAKRLANRAGGDPGVACRRAADVSDTQPCSHAAHSKHARARRLCSHPHREARGRVARALYGHAQTSNMASTKV